MLGLAAIPVIGPFLAAVPAFVWKWAGIAAVCLAAYFYVDLHATYRERAIQVAKCQAAADKAQKQADNVDLEAEKAGRAQDLEITNSLIAAKAKDDAEIKELQAKLAKSPQAARCVLTQPDLDWLR